MKQLSMRTNGTRSTEFVAGVARLRETYLTVPEFLRIRLHPHFTALPSSRRSGYTLIEMLIASVLIAALMSAVWGLLSLYSSFLSAGRDDAATQQLARSLFDVVSDDLRHVAIVEGRSERIFASGTGKQFSLDESAFTTTDLLASTSGEVPVPGTQELVGTAESLMLTRLQLLDANRAAESPLIEPVGSLADLNSAMPESVTVPDIVTVVYQFELPHAANATTSRLPGGLHRVEMDSQQWQAALQSRVDVLSVSEAESELDRFMLESLLYGPSPDARTADLSGATAADNTPDQQAVPRHEHIPEVVRCRFAYFDGNAWGSRWDSRASGALPKAVRVDFSILSPSELRSMADGTQNGTVADDELDQSDRAKNAETVVGADGKATTANPFLTAQPDVFQRIILLSPVEIRRGRFSEDSRTSLNEPPFGRTLP
jgi:prepilin-type N-terminal cleavage/methylation domain-containing protein